MFSQARFKIWHILRNLQEIFCTADVAESKKSLRLEALKISNKKARIRFLKETFEGAQ